MDLMPKRWIAATTIAVVTWWALTACGGGSDSDDGDRAPGETRSADVAAPNELPPGLEWLVPPQEAFATAQARIEEAIASDDCAEVVALAWGGGSALSDDAAEEQCEILRKRFGDGAAAQQVEMDPAGGVAQYQSPDRGRATRAVLVVAEDGLYRPAFFDYVPKSAQLKPGRASSFAKAADKAIAAMAAGSCRGVAEISHYTQPRSRACDIAEGALAEAVERKDRTVKAVGSSADYALFAVRAHNVYWVMVMARQPKDVRSAANAYPEGDAPEYVLANVVRLATPS